MRKKILTITSIFILLGSLSACVPKKLNVLVSNYPVEFLVQRIAGDLVNVNNISTGDTPQRAQIREDYEVLLDEGDVFFHINELEPYLGIYGADFKDNKVQTVNLADRSFLYPFQRYTTVYSADKTAVIEEKYYSESVFDSIDTYENDPILWMDPIAMTSMARTIKDYLSDVRSDDARFFQNNFDDLEVELTLLQTDYQNLRDQNYQLSFATMTPSFGNWQKSFNISVYPVTLSKYGALPTNEQYEIIRNRLELDGVQFIVMEENLPEDYVTLLNQLKTELNLEVITLTNLFKLKDSDLADKFDYIDVMYRNLETLEAMTKEQ